ncbi:MAG TPA: M14 family zinc carboxypeptidase [Chloroflexia bacterium]|nr:M14 family zinc carboxypeptidase [Chloroflexia bacterium]
MRNNYRKAGSKTLAALALAALFLAGLPGSGSGQQVRSNALVSSAQDSESDTQPLALRVYPGNDSERQALALEFGLEKVTSDSSYLPVWADRIAYNNLLARGLRVEIDEELTREIDAIQPGSGGPDTFYGGYRTVEDVEALLDGFVSSYPGLAEKIDIGDSWCKAHPGACILPEPYNGYDIWALHVTNRAIPGDKPVFWYDAGIHSREIATPEVAVRFIEWLLDGYASNADAHWLVDYHDIWIVPILNPDGHHIVESGGGGSSPYLHRKNAANDDGCSDWPPSNGSQFGVDLNRNFIRRWGCCNQSSTDPCHLAYRGMTPGSEDETQAVINKVRTLIPDQRGELDTDSAPITTTGLLQTMHSFGATHLYPSTFVPNPVPNAEDMRNMVLHFAAPDAGGSGYNTCQPPSCYAIIDGTTIMWAYGELGIPSFTTEVSGDFFLPDYSFVETIWEENRGPLIYQAKLARTPYLTTRGPDTNAVTVEPGIVTPGTQVHITATISHAWTGNVYAQNVAAAEYYIDTPPWAGGTPVVMQPSDGAFDSMTENVEADLDSTGLLPGRHIIFVRGRGIAEYEGYPSWGIVSAQFLDVVTELITPTPVATSSPTQPATVTSVPTPSATGTPTPTIVHGSPSATMVGSATPTACAIEFTDVSESHTFYSFIRCLACRGIISGYSDGTFKPGNEITRSQIAKMVSNAAGLENDPGSQIFEDVPPTHTFYAWINRLSQLGYMGGYPCGTIPEEPCEPPDNRPYFRPFANATRGQLAKIVANTAGIGGTPTGLYFTDVPEEHPFYVWIMRLTNLGVMGGYLCGGEGEPCDDQNRPYFRPFTNVTRGQASKIVANTFFPNCQTTRR